MATVAPPMANIRVYFRVFDVDDPFDQIHGPDAGNNPGANPARVIPDVNLIDNNQIGGDNRGVTTGLGNGSDRTDANGEARITISVSMQPGGLILTIVMGLIIGTALPISPNRAPGRGPSR